MEDIIYVILEKDIETNNTDAYGFCTNIKSAENYVNKMNKEYKGFEYSFQKCMVIK